MTIKSVRAVISRVSLRVRLFLASFLDRGLDSVVADLSRLSERLERRINYLAARRIALTHATLDSAERERAIMEAEKAVRERLGAEYDDTLTEEGRARRIRRRVAEFLD